MFFFPPIFCLLFYLGSQVEKDNKYINSLRYTFYIHVYTGFGARSVTIYRENILNDALLPWARKQFGRNHWTFQQDSPHRARETQRFLQEKVPSFNSSQQWPPYSPDLNRNCMGTSQIFGSKCTGATPLNTNLEHLLLLLILP